MEGQPVGEERKLPLKMLEIRGQGRSCNVMSSLSSYPRRGEGREPELQ